MIISKKLSFLSCERTKSPQNIVVLDTSIFIENSYILDNFIKSYYIIIPEIVYLELLHLKDSNNSYVSSKAATALEEIEYFSIKSKDQFRVSRKSSNKQLDKEFDLDFQNHIDGNDNRILATALYYDKVPYNNTFLVSNDKKLTYMAKAYGLKTKSA